MKSDVIRIDNQGCGFKDAICEVEKAAQYRGGLTRKDELQLRLCAEEMLSLARSVTGEMEATFWIESEGKSFDLHLATKTVMDSEKRRELIASATSRKNEAAKTFLGKLRDTFEAAMAADPDYSGNGIPDKAVIDLLLHPDSTPEWDMFEQSVLRETANEVKIAVRGGKVDMTVNKSFA